MIKRTLYKIEKRLSGFLNRFIYSRNITGSGNLLCDHNCVFDFGKGSQMVLSGRLTLSDASYFNNKRSSIILLQPNARFITNNSSIYYGASIKIYDNGVFRMGESFINSDCRIECRKNITIGNGCAISFNFCAMDSNAHEFNGERKCEDIVIEDHVWIGSNVTVLPGVTIGEGAVIASNSLVNKDVPPRTLAGGIPAKVLKSDVEWNG